MPGKHRTEEGLSRRDAAARLAALSLLGATALPSSVLGAQSRRRSTTPTPSTPAAPAGSPPAGTAPGATQPSQPADPNAPPKQTKPSPLDKVITPGREGKYTLRVNVHVNHFQRVLREKVIKEELAFDTATVVFPVLIGSASHATDIESADQVDGKLSFNDQVVDDTPELEDGKDCGTRLAIWKMGKAKGGELDLKLSIPMRTWSTVFDESIAAKATWPKQWTKTPQSCFNAGTQFGVDYTSPEVRDAVKEWTSGKDPQSIPPLTLAKYLASKVFETVRINDSGVVTSRVGTMEGVDVGPKAASKALRTQRANPFEATCAMCAVYLAAGLPARPVIGYDIKAKKADDRFLDEEEGSNKIVSWVEFCLLDEDANKEAWVPVDIARQRDRSSRLPDLDKPWDYFGNNKDLQYILPFAFQFHPPVSVVAHGSPAFWGWFTTPTINNQAEQWIKFDAVTTPNRGR